MENNSSLRQGGKAGESQAGLDSTVQNDEDSGLRFDEEAALDNTFAGSLDGGITKDDGDGGRHAPTTAGTRTDADTNMRRKEFGSLKLRQLPDHVLLSNQKPIRDDLESLSSQSISRRKTSFLENVPSLGLDAKVDLSWFDRTFLKPKYSLRRQLLLSFGTFSSLIAVIIMVVAIAASVLSGKNIKVGSRDDFELLAKENLGHSVRYISEAMSPKLFPTGLVQILHDVTSDRFVGYPNSTDDSQTPFYDTSSRTNVYPIREPPLPLDWDFHSTNEEKGNVNDDNFSEHVQNRWRLYKRSHPRISTSSAYYFMQGSCDPRITNTSSMVYYENCTNANNDLSTGGVVAPSNANQHIARKGADLGPVLKALFEYHQSLKAIGLYFANRGAGAVVHFPHYEIDGTGFYESVGCDWMRADNPLDPSLGPIGTEEEIALCHPEGTSVSSRKYNPLERGWCRDQALNPYRIQSNGPYLDAFSDRQWLMAAGRPIYDRRTKTFVACMANEYTLDSIEDIIEEINLGNWSASVTVVRWDDEGTIVRSPNFDFDSATKTTTVDDVDVGTGVDKDMFEEMKNLFDFNEAWTPEDATDAFESKTFLSNGTFISIYPIPSIPIKYDAAYQPELMVILSHSITDDLDPIMKTLSGNIDEKVRTVTVVTVSAALVGLTITIIFIFGVASYLTKPLDWMNCVSEQIVEKFGDDVETGIVYERKHNSVCNPQTELTNLEQEFGQMISKFSGQGTSNLVKNKRTEKKNTFLLSTEFSELYRSRGAPGFPFNYSTSSALQNAEGSSKTHNQSPEKCHFGPNILETGDDSAGNVDDSYSTRQYGTKTTDSSPLFRWIILLIAIPLLTTAIIIFSVVVYYIANEIPSLLLPMREGFLRYHNEFMTSTTLVRVVAVSQETEQSIRDLHILTRYASWLLFGGIQTSDSFTKLLEGTEDCKASSGGPSACAWHKNLPCDCFGKDCTDLDSADVSRREQVLFFACQSHDARSDGSRNFTSFPDVSFSPETTAWWDNIYDLPRIPKSSDDSSKYATTYDRIKTFSAISTVLVPLYNYGDRTQRPFGSYVSFEADGTFAGYNGCDYETYAGLAFWNSTESNGAADLRPELCPLGFYGFDPRCRGWYDAGKKLAEQQSPSHLHITAPYEYADSTWGQSATSPLIDPQTTLHIGQTLIDFSSSFIPSLLLNGTSLSSGGFPMLIVMSSGENERDAVNHVFAFEQQERFFSNCTGEINSVERCAVLKNMTEGKNGSATVDEEKVRITYAPVNVRNYRPLDSSDISRGVEKQDSYIYSLAFVELEECILEGFDPLKERIIRDVTVSIVLLTVIFLFLLCVFISIGNHVVRSITEPIVRLLGVVTDINKSNHMTDKDLHWLKDSSGFCKEVRNVCSSLEILYKVVCFANAAFLHGDIKQAYTTLRNSLRLFGRLGNKKAMAVASNNLGNTMLAFYRTMKATKKGNMCGLSEKEIVAKGTAYFVNAIKLGEEAYDDFYNEQGWSEECLAFMQLLSNRYFNRAIFLLSVKNDHEHPVEAEEMGSRDMTIVRDMDTEIVDQCIEMAFKIDRVERHDLMMSRVRGALSLVELGYSPEIFDIQERKDEVVNALKLALKKPDHELFETISPAGRMQQLDTELINYFSLVEKDVVGAARVAVRMLVEDEYIYPESQSLALQALSAYMSDLEDMGTDTKAKLDASITKCGVENRSSVSSSLRSFYEDNKDDLELFADGEHNLQDEPETAQESYRQSTRGDFSMETF